MRDYSKMTLAQLQAEASKLTAANNETEFKVVEKLIIEKTAAAKQAAATAPAPAPKKAAAPAKTGRKFIFVPVEKSLYRVTITGTKADSMKIRKLRSHKASEIKDVAAGSAKFNGLKVKEVKVMKTMLFTAALPEKFADVANKLVGRAGVMVA